MCDVQGMEERKEGRKEGGKEIEDAAVEGKKQQNGDGDGDGVVEWN